MVGAHTFPQTTAHHPTQSLDHWPRDLQFEKEKEKSPALHIATEGRSWKEGARTEKDDFLPGYGVLNIGIEKGP